MRHCLVSNYRLLLEYWTSIQNEQWSVKDENFSYLVHLNCCFRFVIYIYTLVIFNFFLVSAGNRPQKNATQTLEEITSLHHLLHAYESILYRYNEESINGRGLDNFQSTQGRPDRPRSKFTTDQAIHKLKKVDEIFPWYAKYFNETKDDTSFSSVMDVLHKRVDNIEKKLKSIENRGNQEKGVIRLVWFGVVGVIVSSSWKFVRLWSVEVIQDSIFFAVLVIW